MCGCLSSLYNQSVLFSMLSSNPVLFPFFILPALFLVAGIFDVLTGRIPDWIVLTISGSFLVYVVLAGWKIEMVLYHCGIAALVFLAGFVVFILGWAGGGDGKLATAGALWFGPSVVVDFLTLSFIFGGVLVGIAFFLRHIPLPEFLLRQTWLQRWIAGDDGLPFGLAMAAAVLVLRQIGFDLPVQSSF